MNARIPYKIATFSLALLLVVAACLAACDTVQDVSVSTDETTTAKPDVTTSPAYAEPDVTTADMPETTAPEATTEAEPTTEPETNAPEIIDTAFYMSYAFLSGETATVQRNGTLSVTLTIRNDGEAFELMGSSSGFAPTAQLVGKSGTTVDCLIPHTNDFVVFTVETGETSSCHGDFLIDGSVPAGEYDLVLSFGDVTVTFPAVVTVE